MSRTTTYRRNGATRTVPNGFSVTTLIFGFLPSMIRGQWGYLWIVIAADVVGLFLSGWVFKGQDALASVAVLRFGAAALRNEFLARLLMKDGWKEEPKYRSFMAANDQEM